MTAPKALTRKAGPLPVWVWVGLALAGAYIVHKRSGSTPAAQATAVPVGATTTGADTGAMGSSSNPLDNSGGDLLSSLLGNQNAYEQLLSALQLGDVGVGGGGSPGGSGGGVFGGVPAPVSSSTSAASASVDATATPSSAGIATTDNTNPYAYPAVISGGQTNEMLPADQQVPGLPPNAYVIGGPSQVAAPVPFGTQPFGTFTQPVASPTPTAVQPSPVDTSVVMPGTRATIQAPVAV